MQLRWLVVDSFESRLRMISDPTDERVGEFGAEGGIWLKIQQWFIRSVGLWPQAALTGRCVASKEALDGW